MRLIYHMSFTTKTFLNLPHFFNAEAKIQIIYWTAHTAKTLGSQNGPFTFD